jgi:Adenine-specific DNA methylase
MRAITILNYQGNKTSLMPFISKNIQKYVSQGAQICDIFSGSGSVGAYLKDEYSIVSNDAELYSSIISSALLNTPLKKELIHVKDLFLNGYKSNFKFLTSLHEEIIASEKQLISTNSTKELINLYKSFPTIWNDKDKQINPKNLKYKNEYNLFLYYYSGTYFGINQSIEIDSIVKTIHEISSENTQNVLLSCLFYAMKETVFSKDGHMAQPLNIEKNSARHIKQRNKKVISYFWSKLDEFILISSNTPQERTHEVFNLDISELLKNESFIEQPIKLIYADPPYTDMQYSRYYHLLNVVAKYDFPEPTISRGQFTKGLYTEGRNQSELSKKSTAKKRLQELFTYCQNNNIVLALSYAYPKDEINQKTDRYTISIEELVNMAKRTFGNKKVQIEQENYRHANHRNSSTKEVLEYLILCGQEIHKSEYDLLNVKKELRTLIPTSKNPVYNTHLYWSQKSFNVIDTLINNLSTEGDVIFDPFMGSGVTILEAVQNKMNRIGIGSDVNEMSKFITGNILRDIPQSDLELLFNNFNEKLESLLPYYTTTCPKCAENGIISKVVFDKPNRTINTFTIKAISFNCPHCGKQIKEANNEDYAKFTKTTCDRFVPNLKLMQNSKIAIGVSDTISDIFTPRNFSVLNEIVEYINNSEERNILNYLLMSILHLAKITDTHSNSQWPLWIPKTNCVEKNIIDLLQRKMKNLIKAQEYIKSNYSNSQIVESFKELTKNDALVLTKGSQFITQEEVPDDSISLIITDPPYMDQVLYSEYMQLYNPFIGINFNIEDEIIVSAAPERKRGKEQYFTLLSDVFQMCRNKLKENHIMCLFFHDSNLDVWVQLMELLEDNGFRFISQEHIKKSKTIKNILSPKKSLSGDAILFFENTRTVLPKPHTSISTDEIKYSVYLEAKKLLEKHGDLSTPELYDIGIMEMLIENGWLKELAKKYKSLVEIFEEYFIWKRESAKWHLQG